jgi:hypothetical protein
MLSRVDCLILWLPCLVLSCLVVVLFYVGMSCLFLYMSGGVVVLCCVLLSCLVLVLVLWLSYVVLSSV